MNAMMRATGRLQVLSDDILGFLVGEGKSDIDPSQEEVYRRQYKHWETNARGHEFKASLGYIADPVHSMNFS